LATLAAEASGAPNRRGAQAPPPRGAAGHAPTEIIVLRAALSKKIELVIGGSGAPSGIKGTTTFADVRALDVWAEALARPRSPR